MEAQQSIPGLPASTMADSELDHTVRCAGPSDLHEKAALTDGMSDREEFHTSVC
jgi:hypothetical protein